MGGPGSGRRAAETPDQRHERIGREVAVGQWPQLRYVIERKATRGQLKGRFFPEYVAADRSAYRDALVKVRDRFEGRQDLVAWCVLIDAYGRRLRQHKVFERPAVLQ